MNVVLIGYRACGKSTIGKLLAVKLRYSFQDTDLLVEESLGLPIKEIVASGGWDYFRAQERGIVQQLAQKEESVIATGGGVVLSPENIDLLKKKGIVIWLDAPLQDIIERLNDDAQTDARRPQFTTGSLANETNAVLKQRTPLYQKAADFTVKTEDKSAAQVVEEIVEYLKKKGRISEN